MILKLVAIDVETGNFVFKEVPEGMPAGTTTGSILRWNSSDWVQSNHTTLTDDSNSVSFKMINGTVPSGKYAEMKVTDSLAMFFLQLDGAAPYTVPNAYMAISSSVAQIILNHTVNRFITLNSYATYQVIGVNSGGDTFNLYAYLTPSDANKVINFANAGGDFFNVYGSGKIFSKSLTANTYLGANANKEIVSIPSPNTIKHLAFDVNNLPVDLPIAVGSGWVNLPGLNFMLEPSVNYELDFLIAIEGAQGRNFKLRLNTATATYYFRPFSTNTSGAATDILYAKDGTYGIPLNMDNEADITIMTGNYYHFTELKGILKTTNNIANAQFQIYNDSANTITVKAFSYLKLSR